MFELTKKQIESLPLLEGKNKGAYGICYKYNDYVIKVLRNDNIFFDTNKKRTKKLVGIKVEDVAFPIDIIEEEDFFAIKQDYIDGTLFPEIKYNIFENNITFNDVSKIFIDGKYKVEQITDNGIYIIDLNPFNCKLIDNLKLGIMDTDSYLKDEISYKRLKKDNVATLNLLFRQFIKEFLVKLENKHYLYDYLNKSDRYNAYYVDDCLEKIVKETKAKTLGELMK